MVRRSVGGGVVVSGALALFALAVDTAVLILFIVNDSPIWAIAAMAIATAATGRAILLLPRGDERLYLMLWTALGVTLGMTIIGALSVGPAVLLAVVMLGGAIAVAPNRTGHARASVRYVAFQTVAFLLTISAPFVV